MDDVVVLKVDDAVVLKEEDDRIDKIVADLEELKRDMKRVMELLATTQQLHDEIEHNI